MISVGQEAGNLASLTEGLYAAGVDFEQLKRDQVQLVEFDEYFHRQNELMFRRQSSLWSPILRKGLRHELFNEGHQALTRDGLGYKVKEISEENRHRIFVVNRIRPYSNEQAAMFMSANPKVNVIVKDADPTREQRRIDAADAFRDHINYLWFTADRLQRWAKHAQFHGRYRGEVWFDRDNKRGQELVPTYQQISQSPMVMVECLQCGELNTASPEQAVPGCAACGSPYVQRHEIGGVEPFMEQTGSEWREAGEVECIFDPTWAARFSLTVGKDLSPWFYHERDEVKEVVEAKYNVKLPAQTSDHWQHEEMLHPGRILRRAEQQRSFGGGGGSGQDDESVLVQRFYYEKEMLHFVALKTPKTLPNGEVIPAGVRLSETCLSLCFKTAPGLAQPLDVYKESHKDRFIEGEYDISPGKAIARGNEEAPDYQKWTNVLLSGAFDGALKTLQPSLAVVDEVFPDGRLFNRDDRTIRIKLAQLKALGENASIGHAMGLMPAPSLNSGISDLISLFTAEQRRITGTETYLGAEDQSVDPETATAANIGEDRNARVNSLQLANFAIFQLRLLERAFMLGRDNYGEVVLIGVTDEDKRRRISRELRRADLMGSIEMHVEKDSWLPNLTHKQQVAFKMGMGVYGVAQQAGIANPQLVKRINQVFGIDLMTDRRNERIANCEEILEQIREKAPLAASSDELYAQNPVILFDPHHEMKAMWWQDVRTRRDAQGYHPFVIEVMDRYIIEHALALMQMRDGLASIAAIGQGLLAPPVSSGMSAENQKPPMLPPPAAGQGAGKQAPAQTANQ